MCPDHPFPKSHGNPKSMNKLTLNEPATRKKGEGKDMTYEYLLI